MIDVRGHQFQAAFVCLPTGELSDPAIHGSRSDAMTPEQRIELEGEARAKAMELKASHGPELLAGMSVVAISDLRRCVAHAPSKFTRGDVHRLEQWDALTGADKARTPPLTHPTLSAHEYDHEPAWLFWGTLDTEVDASSGTQAVEQELLALLGAKFVQVRTVWLWRPEVWAFF
jgi:hypothetical protein